MKIGEDIVAFSSQFKDCDPMAMQLGLALMNAREAEYKDEWGKPESKARQMTFEEATEQC